MSNSHHNPSDHIQLLPLRARPQPSHYVLIAHCVSPIVDGYHQQNWGTTKQVLLKQHSGNGEEMLLSLLQRRDSTLVSNLLTKKSKEGKWPKSPCFTLPL